jgi:hypothetical protein
LITVSKTNGLNEARSNFRSVLESAYADYYHKGLSNDLAAITLGKLEENDQSFSINEMIELASSLPSLLNEEATNVTNPHIVHEKKGLGISVTVNGKEYRYVSPDVSTPELFRSFMGMYKHANSGYKALNFLKRVSLCYYGAKNPKGKELVESTDPDLEETTQPSDVPPTTSDIAVDPEEQKTVLTESVDGATLFNTSKSGMSFYDDFLNPKDHDYKKLAKGLKGTIVMMSPDEYINRLAKDIFHCSKNRVYYGVDQTNVEAYAAKMKAGTKFDIPVLDLARETQEGRHRALAAASLGARKIPVLVVEKYDKYKELGMPKSMDLWYGHTLVWTDKDGIEHQDHVGLNEEAMKAKIKQVMASGNWKK